PGRVEHVFMMNEGVVQDKIADVMGVPRGITVDVDQPATPPATRKQMSDFLEGVRAEQHSFVSSPQAQLDAILRKYTKDQIEALIVRGYIDLMKSPSQLVGEDE